MIDSIAVAVGTREAALDYAARGWRVLPLHGIEPDGSCTCGRADCPSPGKHPRTRHGMRDATTDLETIRDWWDRWPDANVGIATGRGLMVLDVDGEEGQANISGQHVPATPCVHTGRGSHLYLRPPEGVRVRNAVGLAPGLDVRAEGGYVVAPPSRHASGVDYEWAISPDVQDLAECPLWLADLLRSHEHPEPRAPEEKARDDADERSVTIPEGRRNTTLTSYAGRLRAVGMPYEEIATALLAHNAAHCKPLLSEGEVRGIARSAAGWPAGPVRIDNRIINADLGDGAKLLGALLATLGAEATEEALALAAGRTVRTVACWREELREADLEAVALERPTRRYARLPRGLLLDPNLSVSARVIALILARTMSDGESRAGQEALADHRGTRRQVVGRQLQALERAGYVMVARTAFCGKRHRRQACNRYRFVDTEMSRRAPQERQGEAARTPELRKVVHSVSPELRKSSTTRGAGGGSTAVQPCSTAIGRGCTRARPANTSLPEGLTADEWHSLTTYLHDAGRKAVITHLPELIQRHGVDTVLQSIGCEEVAKEWNGRTRVATRN